MRICYVRWICFFFQAEDGIRDLVRSRGLGDVYKRQDEEHRSLHGVPLRHAEGTAQPVIQQGAPGKPGELSLIHI